MSKDSFKNFVRQNPNLAKYVNENKTTWQKIYEIYELYGENHSIWNEYRYENKVSNSFNEIIKTIKTIDLEKLQSGIENIQSTISLIQNFGNNNQTTNYEPKYHYQHLDD
jgi:hypothetical protein